VSRRIGRTEKRESIPSVFGRLVAELQGDEKRIVFAGRLGVGESTIGNVTSGGRQRSPKLLAALVAAFPDREEEIVGAYNASPEPTTPQSPPRRDRNFVQQKVAAQIKFGRLAEAKHALELAIDKETNAREQMWQYELLAEIRFAEGDEDDGLRDLATAIHAGDRSDADSEMLAPLRNRLASRHQRRDEFGAAHAVLDEGLLLNPRDDVLWRRKGIVHWYEHAYGNAYSALAAALYFDHPIRRIIHSRGCVLGEWGNLDAALQDLDAIIDDQAYPFTPVSLAYARSARGHVYAQRGETDRALREFDRAEGVVPESSWLHYFRGLCYFTSNSPQLATKSLQKALSEGTHLNLPKRLRAQRILCDLGADDAK
jgi:tetratricopeptide (TPR) repeat protein